MISGREWDWTNKQRDRPRKNIFDVKAFRFYPVGRTTEDIRSRGMIKSGLGRVN